MSAVEKALEEAKKAVEKGGKEEIDRAVAELTKASHKIAEELYKQTAAAVRLLRRTHRAAEDRPRGCRSGDVIDAEVVDKK